MLNNLEITYSIHVKSTQDGASILLDGVDTYKTTPESVLIRLSDLYAAGPQTITVKKQGYVTQERYILKVMENPQFTNYNGNTYSSPDSGTIAVRGEKIVGTGEDADKVEQSVTQIPSGQVNNPSYSNIPQYVINIQYFIGDRAVGFVYKPESQLQTIEFNLTEGRSELPSIDENPEGITETVALITINVEGPENSVTVSENGGDPIVLVTGTNTIMSEMGSTIIISSTDESMYQVLRAEKFLDGLSVDIRTTSEDFPSLRYRFLADNTYVVNITTSPVFISDIDIPVIEFTGQNSGVYNINEKVHVPIGLIKRNVVTSILVSVNNKQFTFSDLGSEDVFIALIPHEVFDQLGVYTLQFTPRNSFGTGKTISYNLNVIDGVYVGTPDIINIRYPSLIQGPDFVGFDVDFNINWESINTDYIHLNNGSSTNFIQLSPQGPQTLNFKQLLQIDGGEYSEDEREISIVLKLTPYNISGRELVIGKTEILNIRFIKGKLSIPRHVAINRIIDGFFTQLETDVFNDETSRYLTHALHLGDADNKVITTWTGSLYEDVPSLILKLYEPLPTTVQPNQQVWISKYQSNPILETVTVSDFNGSFCTPLKGPNFSVEIDNGIGYRIFDELIGSDNVESSAQLVDRYAASLGIDLTRLNIRYRETDGTYLFNNFVNFSSAEERINNFIFKLQTIEEYESKISGIQSDATWGSSIELSKMVSKYQTNIITLKRGFDGFEKFMYTGDYPLSSGNPVLVASVEGEAWYNNIIESAIIFDTDNPNYLNRNIPKFITFDFNNSDFIVFLDMIGHHYDIIWSYINELTRLKHVDERSDFGISSHYIWDVLKSFGWDGIRAFDSDLLWEYVLGEDKNGNKKYSIPLEDANNLLWRRILNNLPFILKNKGTARSMKAIMAAYGVSQSTLTIMEFGGPTDPDSDNSTEFTFEDVSYSLKMESGNSITVPWKAVGGFFPQAIELNIKPDTVQNSTIITVPGFTLGYESNGSTNVRLNINSVLVGPEFTLSTDDYTSILVNHNGGGNYDIKLRTTDGERIFTSVDISYSTTAWTTAGTLIIGGNYNGQVDELKLWRLPLSETAFMKHVYFPESTSGDTFDSSTTDLLFRLDFSLPKNLNINTQINNVAVVDLYGEPNGTAVGFTTSPNYPYQFQWYERTVTAVVPSLGFGYSNKMRFENQTGLDGTQLFDGVTNEQINGLNLSHKIRSTQKSYDRAPIDTNRLGIFLSPIRELNMDIIKTFGQFHIDDYIGDPGDEYKDRYSELEKLRKYYFQRIDLNINEYIGLVKYIDKSLFDVMASLAPARARVSKGLLIEPHFLERSKVRWDKPVAKKNDYTASIHYMDETEIVAKYNVFTASIYDEMVGYLSGSLPMYTASILYTSTFEPDFTTYDVSSEIKYNYDDTVSGSVHFYSAHIFIPFGEVPLNSKSYGSNPLNGASSPQMTSTLDREDDAIGISKTIGFDSFTTYGYGLYGENGYTTYQDRRARAFVIEREVSRVVSTQTGGWPTLGALPGDQVVYEDVVVTDIKKEISILTNQDLIDVGYTIPVSGDTVSILPLDGITKSHYRYTSGITGGFIKSFYEGSVQNRTTTPDGLPPVQTFNTNANVLRVTDTGARGSGEPILSVD